MKVIHSCTSRSYSGLEKYVVDLAYWQYQKGKAVEVFCRENTPIAETAKKRGLPVWEIGADEGYGPKLWFAMRNRWLRATSGEDVVLHLHAGGEPWYHLPWLLLRSRRSKVRKVILHYHIWINHKKRDPLHWLLFSAIDEVWTSSETARAHLSTILPVSREKIRVVPYGRDVQVVEKLVSDSAVREVLRTKHRTQLAVASDELVGICVSRLEPIKGIGELFDGFIEAAVRSPKLHLVVVGDASPENQEAESFARTLKERYLKLPEDIRRRLHFTGYRDDALELMAASDFYVLPSYEECMSLAMLDALILGLPILGTNTGGTPSVARPDETGMLVPARDAKALGHALTEISADRKALAVLSQGAKALGQEFNQETIFSRIWNWYQT